MAAQGAIKNWFTFVNGLNTEGGYFVTPPEAWKEGDNVIPNVDGTINRRNGIDLEENASSSVTAMPLHYSTKWAYATAQWNALPEDAVAGKKYNFLVVQYGPRIVIFNNDSLTTSSEVLFQFTLTAYPADYFQSDEIYTKDKIGKEPCSFAVVNGQLIIVSNVTTPIRIEHKNTSSQFIITPFSLSIRDFEGIDTFGLATSVEKTQAEWNTYYNDLGVSDGYNRALYNLYNQGWTDSQINPYKTANSSKLPANSKMWIYGKDASDNFDPALLNKQDFGSINAAKGRTILDLFYQERTAIITFTTQYDYRPTQVGFFAGRAWYAGLQGTMSGRVLFSQVLDNTNKLGNCYQANDPTSEVASDVLDSDGGVIEIPEAGQIKKLVAVGKGLLVFATNGVYNISGIDSVFSANNYQVEKITNVGCIASNSIVTVESNVIYWATDGIYVISNVGLEYKVDNMSDKTIKTLYNNIPFSGKQYVTGVYNPSTNEVMWLYNSSKLEDETSNLYGNNSLLVFNRTLTCFYTHSFNPINNETSTEKYVASIFLTSTEPSSVIEETVTNNSLTEVENSSDELVTASVIDNKYYNQQFKFLIVYNYKKSGELLFASTSNYALYSDEINFSTPYTQTASGDDRFRVMQFKRTGQFEHIYFTLSSWFSYYPNNTFTSTLCLYNQNSGDQYTIELGSSCIGSLLPTNFGAQAVVFNKDGTRLYVSALKNDSTEVIWGYFPITTGYDLSTIGSFVTLETVLYSLGILSRKVLHHDLEFITDDNGNAFLNTAWNYTPDAVNYTLYLYTYPLTLAEAVNYDVGVLTTHTSENVAIDGSYGSGSNEVYLNAFAFITKSKGEFVYLYSTNSQEATSNQRFLVLQLQENYKLSTIYRDFSYTSSEQYLNADAFPQDGTSPFTFITNSQLDSTSNGNYYANEKWNFVKITRVYTGTPGQYYLRWDDLWYDMPEESTQINNWSNTVTDNGISICFADFLNTRSSDTTYKDFYSISGSAIEQSAYVITGYELGDVGPARNKTGMYLSTFIKRTETGVDDVGELINPGSVQMSLQWDFTDQYSTNKWSTPVEVYRQPRAYIIPSFPTTFDDGYPLVISKSKMRGRGKAVQFKFESKAGHDFNIVGWTGTFVGSTNV